MRERARFRPLARGWVTVAWLVACGPKAAGESASVGDTGTGAGTEGASITAAVSGGPLTGSGTTTGTTTAATSSLPPPPDLEWPSNFLTPPDLVGPPDCDPQAQDCPAGQKCMPYDPDGGGVPIANACFPVVDDPVGLGEPCVFQDNPFSGLDNCDVGAMCWDSDGMGAYICDPLCSGSLDVLTCPPGYLCSVFWEELTVCEIPACDPLKQDCADPEELCIPNIYWWEDWCMADDTEVDSPIHGPCEAETECDKGLVCVSTQFAAIECMGGAAGCCEPFCELGVDACPGVGQVCKVFYDVPGLGVCQLP